MIDIPKQLGYSVRMKANQLKNWQKDETNLTTEKVQVWGDTMVGLISQADAREMVRNGTNFVISAQAVGALEANESVSNKTAPIPQMAIIKAFVVLHEKWLTARHRSDMNDAMDSLAETLGLRPQGYGRPTAPELSLIENDDGPNHRCSIEHSPCPACELLEEREHEREAGL